MAQEVYFILAKTESFIGLMPIKECYDKQELFMFLGENLIRGNYKTIKICKVDYDSKLCRKYEKLLARVKRQEH